MSVNKTTKKATIKDIAEAAGVSVSTVSNVLSGKRQIHSPAGQHVLTLAKKMGYVPVRKQRLRKTIRFIIYKQHGLVIMDTPFFSDLIAGIEQECQRNNYELVISYIYAADKEDTRERLSTISADNTTPILLLATEMDETSLTPFLNLNVPLVAVDSWFHHQKINTVIINNYEAGYMATRHLIEKGHTHIGFIGSSIPFNNMRDQKLGFDAALKENDLSFSSKDIFLLEPTMEDSVHDMQSLLEYRFASLPTAFFAANDILAAGASRALKTLGYHLPEDVSIIGMDDVPLCQIVNPTLSTISVPKYMLGAVAVQRLIQIAQENQEATPIYLTTQVGVQLVSRESVKTAPI